MSTGRRLLQCGDLSADFLGESGRCVAIDVGHAQLDVVDRIGEDHPVSVQEHAGLYAATHEAHRARLLDSQIFGRDSAGGAGAQRGQERGIHDGQRQGGDRVAQNVDTHHRRQVVIGRVVGVRVDPFDPGRSSQIRRHGAKVAVVLLQGQIDLGRHLRLAAAIGAERALDCRHDLFHGDEAADVFLREDHCVHCLNPGYSSVRPVFVRSIHLAYCRLACWSRPRNSSPGRARDGTLRGRKEDS